MRADLSRRADSMIGGDGDNFWAPLPSISPCLSPPAAPRKLVMAEEIELAPPRPVVSRQDSSQHKNPFRTPSTASLAEFEGFSRSSTPVAQLPDLPSTPPSAEPLPKSAGSRSEIEAEAADLETEEAGQKMRRMSMGDEVGMDGGSLPPIDKGKGAWSFCFAAFILETVRRIPLRLSFFFSMSTDLFSVCSSSGVSPTRSLPSSSTSKRTTHGKANPLLHCLRSARCSLPSCSSPLSVPRVLSLLLLPKSRNLTLCHLDRISVRHHQSLSSLPRLGPHRPLDQRRRQLSGDARSQLGNESVAFDPHPGNLVWALRRRPLHAGPPLA